jgi:hypothetical protein
MWNPLRCIRLSRRGYLGCCYVYAARAGVDVLLMRVYRVYCDGM